MPVALGNVSNQIFDAVEPMVRNRQITAQLAIEKARIKAAKQAQLLNLGKDLFQQFSSQQNQREQQERQIQAQAEQRELDRQNDLAINQQRLQNAAQAGANKAQLQTLKQQIEWEKKVAEAQQRGLVFNDDQLRQQDQFKKLHETIEQNPNLNPAQKAMAHQQVAMREFALVPNKQTLTPEQQFQQNTLQGPDGRLYPKLPDGSIDFQHPLDNKNNAMMDDARTDFYKALAFMKNPTHDEVEALAKRVAEQYKVPFVNPFPPGTAIKGADSAYTPMQIFKEKNDYLQDVQKRREELQLDPKSTSQSIERKIQEEFGPRLQMIREQMDPSFSPPSTLQSVAAQSRNQLQQIQQSLDYVRKNGSIPSPRLTESVKALQDFVAGPTPSDPGLARLQRDIVAVNSTANPQRQLEAARELNQFVENPDVMQSGYAPQGFDQPSSSGSAPPSSSFAPGPQSSAAPPQPPASLMIGGQEATPFQKFVLQGGSLDTDNIALTPVGQQYMEEAKQFGGGVQQALESFNQDKQAFMQSLPIVRDGQFPEGSDVGIDAAEGVVIGKNGSIDNFVTSGAPRRPKGGGGGGKPGGGPPLPKLSGQGGQKPPSQIGSGRPQDKINNPATGKGKQKGVLDPDNPNPRDGLPSKVLLFVNKDERGQKLRDQINKLPPEQRERIQVVDADWDNPDLAAYFAKHGITKGSALPVLIKGEKKADGTYQQIFRNDTYEEILGHMKDSRSMRGMVLHPDEYEPLEAIEDREINFSKHLKGFDDAARRDPSGNALKGMVDPYREEFPGMRPAERINRDVYKRAYEAYRNAQEAGAYTAELQALRDKPIKSLPEVELIKEYERSQRIEARNSLDRAVAAETAKVKEQQVVAPSGVTATAAKYTRDDLRNDVRGFQKHNEAGATGRGEQAQQLQRDRIERMKQWADSVQSDPRANEDDQDLAREIVTKTQIEPRVAQSDPFQSRVFNALTGRPQTSSQADRDAIKEASPSGRIDRLLAEDKASKIQRSPEEQRAQRLADLSVLREKVSRQLEDAQRTISDLNIQKASGTRLNDAQREQYDAAKAGVKYYENQLRNLDSEIKELRNEVAKDQAKQGTTAPGIQSQATNGNGIPLPPVIAGVPPMSLSEFTLNAKKTQVPASNGGTRAPGQQEIKDAYDSYLRDTQNANDARAGRPPSFPNQPPRPANVPSQSNIPNKSGITPASATSSVVQQIARGLTAPFRSAQPPGQRPQPPGVTPRGPDSRAIQGIQRTENQQREQQRRQQQSRDSAIQQGFTTPTTPGMQLNPALRPPNPRGPTAPLRTGQLGQSQLPQILGELTALDQKNRALNPNFTFAYTAGYGAGGTDYPRNRTTGAISLTGGVSAPGNPYNYRAYGANQAQQQQFVQPFLYTQQAGPSQPNQSFGFAPQINPGTNFIIPPSNSGFAGPASQFNGYSPQEFGFYSGEGSSFGGQSGGGFSDPVFQDNANGTNIGDYGDYYVPGGYEFQSYDFYNGGGYFNDNYGGGIDYGGYA